MDKEIFADSFQVSEWSAMWLGHPSSVAQRRGEAAGQHGETASSSWKYVLTGKFILVLMKSDEP